MGLRVNIDALLYVTRLLILRVAWRADPEALEPLLCVGEIKVSRGLEFRTQAG